jgi:hypothetical protein
MAIAATAILSRSVTVPYASDDIALLKITASNPVPSLKAGNSDRLYPDDPA